MIVSRWTGAEVKALRIAALRMTQDEFAAQVGYEPPTIRKWEKATASRPVRGKSAHDLDSALARLSDQQAQRFRAAVADDSLAAGKPRIAREGDEVKRREFGVVLGTAIALPAVESAPIPSRIGIAEAHRLAANVEDIAQREQIVGGTALVQTAVDELERAKAVLETCAFDEQAGKAFMRAAGELATIAGWLAYDSEMHPLARRCYADAFALANQAGDEELTIHVCLNAAHQATTLSRSGHGNPHRALGLIGRARDLSRSRSPGRVHALMAIREAQAYGVLGDRTGFGRAVATAWRELDFAFEHESPEECPRWLRFVTTTEIRCHEARGIGDLGNLAKAATLSAGLALEQAGARNAANYRAGWAAALANAGDIEGATDQGLSVLTNLEREVSSTRTLKLLAPVRDAVEGHSDEFRQRFDDLAKGHTA
ncbi:helix-turn-helix domain-containing protein [Nocardia sp. NPDC050630]|uniref:helix-turn-helix domain-containing protein n=1 Tax=Nocardia sp. NPDC050630 TaxID=3364321 RepID=UPI003795E2F6